jgi:hypothetical protein
LVAQQAPVAAECYEEEGRAKTLPSYKREH